MSTLGALSESAISLPFRIDAQGNIARSTDQGAIWADRVTAAVGTIRGTRVMRAGYGTNIAASFLDTTDAMIHAVEREVELLFSTQFPTLTLDKVLVNYQQAGNIITVDVLYLLPNQQEAATTVGLAYISDTDLIQEVNL